MSNVKLPRELVDLANVFNKWEEAILKYSRQRVKELCDKYKVKFYGGNGTWVAELSSVTLNGVTADIEIMDYIGDELVNMTWKTPGRDQWLRRMAIEFADPNSPEGEETILNPKETKPILRVLQDWQKLDLQLDELVRRIGYLDRYGLLPMLGNYDPEVKKWL